MIQSELSDAIKTAWGAQLTRMPVSAASRLHLAQADHWLLANIGLPSEAAPFLTFEETGSAVPYSPDTLLRTATPFPDRVVLGSTGAGDLICLDKSKDNRITVLLLEDFKEQDMNGSISALAQCLLVFKAAIDEAGGILKPWSSERIELLISTLKRTDPSIEEGGFWIEQCHCLA